MVDNSIIIGKSGERSVNLDVTALLRTHLLIWASTGGGKSFLFRRLVEQMFGKVPIIIVDREGEFATLREKFGFVLVGPGGETPADPRSAKMVAERLLEMHASAVCDLFELSHEARHEWVKNFYEALVNAPKRLWQPATFWLDEAHTFAPEKGQGESIAYGAVTDFNGVARKRGFGSIFATQRLAKLSKNATAEMYNQAAGPTARQADRDRAAYEMGISDRGEVKEFSEQLRTLEPGNFFFQGRAIAMDRVLVKVGPVQTTHGSDNTGKYAVKVPPTPEEVKKMLPKLADLPKQAEEQAKTITEFKAEIRSLKAKLRAVPVVAKEVKVVDQKAIERAVRAAEDEIIRKAKSAIDGLRSKVSGVQIPKAETPQRAPALPPPQRVVTAHVRPNVVPENGEVTGPEQRILDAIAWMESIGIFEPQQTAVAFLAGYTYGGGGFNNPRGALRTKGLVEYRGNGIALTEQGRQIARTPDTPLTTEALHRHVLAVLPGPEQRLLKALLDIYPKDILKEELAGIVGYAPDSGGFNNPCGRLRTLGLVDYPRPGRVIAKDILFVD